MTKKVTLILAALMIAGSFLLFRRSKSDASSKGYLSSVSCGDRYNQMLVHAKTALRKGDRVGAIASLMAARKQLDQCQEQEERNANAPKSIALNTFQPRLPLASISVPYDAERLPNVDRLHRLVNF